MTERSTRIIDRGAGLRYAARDAYELDDGGNARVSGLITYAPDQRVSGGYRSVTSSDSPDLTTVSTAITNAAVDVGDRHVLSARADFEDAGAQRPLIIMTPIALDASNNVLGILEPKAGAWIHLTGGVDKLHFTHELGDGLDGWGEWSGSYYPFIAAASWSVKGGGKYGMHVMFSDDANINFWVRFGAYGFFPDGRTPFRTPNISRFRGKT